ncbi:MAG: peptidase M23 [Bacteroidetes bacterium HGW-Bacteroidetes-21]|jgi:urea transporter|nr:MAG: peptidase M23 [Bacteroidetes bacterium HGW-Bacteroidetes-21]
MRRIGQFFVPVLKGTVKAYPQVFFSDSLLFGIVLLLVSFIDVVAGVSGLIVALSSNLSASSFGLDHRKTEKGLYAFNAVLTGLGIGILFEPSLSLFITLIFTGLLCLAVTVMMEGVTSKYGLPFLSIPFLITIWIVILATREFTELQLSERGVYYINYLYKAGGQGLVDFYQTTQNLAIPMSFYSYLTSLGAIFFQPTVFGGIVIATALFLTSRISFISSLIGFYSAWYFFILTGSDITNFSNSFIGFNFILTSIALGGFFVVPSWRSYLLIILITPVNVLFAQAMLKVLDVWQLPIYSLPFNFIVLIFLYVLKHRVKYMQFLPEVVIQEFSPEKNLYSYKNFLKRFGNSYQIFPIRLPFWGEWSVEQGHNGEFTHKDEYQYAWDFAIRDADNKTFKKPGTSPEDYYCYKKAVLAPGYGKVVKIIDGIPDNEIGKPNMLDNWGNCIIIKHGEFLFSKLCHLQSGSFKVHEEDYVVPGQVLAWVGNSGRSPEPHLHMQLQNTPWVGSSTIKYPISHFVTLKEGALSFHNYEYPAEKCRIFNPEPNRLLARFLDFIPGQKMAFEFSDGKTIRNEMWSVYTDSANKSYFFDERTKSTAWFSNDKIMLYFQYFAGKRKSLLYLFYLSLYKVQTGFYKNIRISDEMNLPQVFKPYQLFLNDLVAPFKSMLTAKYSLTYLEIDDELSPTEIILKSRVTLLFLKLSLKEYQFEIRIKDGLMKDFKAETGKKKWTAKQIS